MRRLDDLPDTDAATRRQLHKAKIKTPEHLWQAIGADFDQGLQRVAHETGTQPERLVEILAEGARPARARVTVWEVVVALGLAVLLLLILWRLVGAVQALPDTLRPAHDSTLQVALVEKLPAFHTMAARDVTLVAKPDTNAAFGRLEDVVGRYLLQPLDSGAVILQDQLSATRLSEGERVGRRMLSLPFNADALNPNVVQGARVTLLFSPRNPAGADRPLPLEVEALVLKVEQRDTLMVLTVAFDEARSEAVGAALATSEVFVTQRLP